jgi:ubiquinone/menaquinone biosynthesis C-methylase UbiE
MSLPIQCVDAFDAIAAEYDSRFTNSVIGQAQRASVWREVDHCFHPGERILEINCGTGVDALHLAARRVHVTACDASAGMVEVARRRLAESPHRERVDFRVLATERINELGDEGRYDGVLSNFAGLNCVADLPKVARDLARIVRPGGRAILCLFGRFCLWEMLWYTLHGDVTKAFRRLSGRPVEAKVAPGGEVLVRYPAVRNLRRDFAPHFRLGSWKGVGITVPPSYVEPCAERWPWLVKFAARLDRAIERCVGLRAFGDHVVLVFKREQV